jgi:hypothetical protein
MDKNNSKEENSELNDSSISNLELKKDIDKIENNSELIETFKIIDIPKKNQNLPLLSTKKERIITNESNLIKDKDIIPEDSNLRKAYDEYINNPKRTIKLNKKELRQKIINKETNNIKNNIPNNIIQFFEPFEIKNSIEHKINNDFNFQFDEFKFLKRKLNFDKKTTPNYYPTETNFTGIDFNLITEIQNKQKEINSKLKELKIPEEEKIKELNKKKSKTNLNSRNISMIKRPLRIKSAMPRKRKLILEPKKKKKFENKKEIYIPNSNKYKEINYKKELIFNSEFPNQKKKRRNIQTACTKAHSIYATRNNDNIYISKKERKEMRNNLNKIQHKLKFINKVMTQDKNFSHRMIQRIQNRHYARDHQEDQFVKKEVRKEKFFALYMENGGLKQQVGINPFGKIKTILRIFNKKGGDPINETLATTLHKFYKREYIEMFMRNQTIKNNVHLRLKKYRMDDMKLKEKIMICEENDVKIKKLDKLIDKKLNETKEIIEKFQKSF